MTPYAEKGAWYEYGNFFGNDILIMFKNFNYNHPFVKIMFKCLKR